MQAFLHRFCFAQVVRSNENAQHSFSASLNAWPPPDLRCVKITNHKNTFTRYSWRQYIHSPGACQYRPGFGRARRRILQDIIILSSFPRTRNFLSKDGADVTIGPQNSKRSVAPKEPVNGV
jgi:hypothetical protein